MLDRPKTFSEFVTDQDGEYSHAQFLSLTQKLLEQGRRPDRVFRAMLRAASDASLHISIAEHRRFVMFAAKEMTEWLQHVEKFCDDALEAQELKKQ